MLQRLFELKMRQNELASHLDVADNTVNQWVNYKREPRVSKLVDMSNFLYCSTDFLVGKSPITESAVALSEDIKQIIELCSALPEDIRKHEIKRLQRLVENYRKT